MLPSVGIFWSLRASPPLCAAAVLVKAVVVLVVRVVAVVPRRRCSRAELCRTCAVLLCRSEAIQELCQVGAALTQLGPSQVQVGPIQKLVVH